MSNDIALPNPSQMPAFLKQAGAATAEEFAGGIAQGFPLAFLSVRGKEFRMRKGGQEVNTRERSLPVIMVASRPTLSKRYFAEGYTSGTTAAPRCSSKDAVTPDVPEPIAEKCALCPKNAWGSGVDAQGNPTKGKACQDYKRLILWAVGLHDDPVVLDVSPTSLKSPRGTKGNEMMLRDYTQALAKHGLDPTMVVTRLQFTDSEYPQLCFRFERYVSEEEYQRVQQLRETDDVQTVIGEDLHEGNGTITEIAAAPSPAPEPPPAPGPAPAKAAPATEQSDADKQMELDLPASEPAEQPAEAKTDEKIGQTKAAPNAPPSTAGDSGEDLMSEISKLLSGSK